MSTLEGSYVKALLARATPQWPSLRFFRRHVTAVEMPSGAFVPIGLKGQCDIYVLEKGGRHFEIEVKNVRGKLDPEQILWREWCVRWRIPWILLQVEKGEQPAQTIERWVGELSAFFAVRL